MTGSASRRPETIERGSSSAVSRGAVVVLDLDRFEEITRQRGYDEYTPNEVTGLLSDLVERLARKWCGVVVYGLDWERGTEEAVIEIPGVEARELEADLVEIAREVEKTGASITVVAVTGDIVGSPASSRREAYLGGFRSYSKKILERLKRRGGGVVYVDGRIAWRSRLREQRSEQEARG